MREAHVEVLLDDEQPLLAPRAASNPSTSGASSVSRSSLTDVGPSAEAVSSSGQSSETVSSLCAIAAWSDSGSRRPPADSDAPSSPASARASSIAYRGFPPESLVNSPERRPRDRLHGPGEDTPQRSHAQRPDVEHLPAARTERARRGEWIGRVRSRTSRGQHADGLGLEPPQHVPQGARRDGVQPLRVVDRDHGRPAFREAPDLVENGASADEGIALGLERRTTQLDVLEQIDEADERERHLLLRRPCDQDLEPRRTAAGHALAPERRLADARLAPDDQRAGSVGESRGERVDASPLGLASEDGRRADTREGGGFPHRAIMPPGRRRRASAAHF